MTARSKNENANTSKNQTGTKMNKYFKPKLNEMRCCRLVKSGCDANTITLEDVFTGELFVSNGNIKYTAKRDMEINEVANKLGMFLVLFDVHMYSTNGKIDANHFAKFPGFNSI